MFRANTNKSGVTTKSLKIICRIKQKEFNLHNKILGDFPGLNEKIPGLFKSFPEISSASKNFQDF